MGGKVERFVKLDISKTVIAQGRANCTVLYVDSFGNVILNITDEDIARLRLLLGDHIAIRTKEHRSSGLVVKTYSDIPRAQLGILQGSQGYLEIATREGSASAKLGLKPLDQVEIRLS